MTDRLGARERVVARLRGRTPTQLTVLGFGAAYLTIGVIGFLVTGFDGPVADTDEALLVFELNPFHNLVHLAVGGLAVGTALAPAPAAAEGMAIGGGLVYLLATVLGFLGYLEFLSIGAGPEPDNWLHLVSGTIALVVGVAGARSGRSDRTATTAGARSDRANL